MNNDIITQQQQNEIQSAMLSFVVELKSNTNSNTLDDITAQFVKDIETQNKNENRDKPKSWWQSIKSAFNRGKIEGNGGIKGFFKGCWEATKTGWRNTNKYAKMAIGAGCLLAGPLLMPLLSVTSSGTSATSATLQSASQFSSLSYNFSYIGYLLSHPTDTLVSSLIAPALSLVTGVGSLISGGVEVARDVVNYVSPNKCFNATQSRWNDIIAYAKYEHKCLIEKTNKTYDINSRRFITSELLHVLRTIKTEYPYFYNSNYPDGQDKDLQVVLNEYLKSLRDKYCNSQLELKHKDVSLELLQNQQHINKLLPVNEIKRDNKQDEKNNNNISNNVSLNESLQDITEGEQCNSGDGQVMKRNVKNNFKKNTKKHRNIRNLLISNNNTNNNIHTDQYNSYKNKNSKNDEIDSNNLTHLRNDKKSYLKNKF